MYMIAVDGVPERKHRGRKHNLYKWLDIFVEMNVKYAKLVLDDREYNNVNSAYTNLASSARYGGFSVSVIRRDGDIYLMRTDM